MQEIINFEDFVKLDLRIGTIVEVERVKGSEKLLKIKVDLGQELGTRQVLSGIAKFYKIEELVGKQVVVIINLASRKIMGLESQGMVLAGGDEAVLIKPIKQVENGIKIY